MAEATQTTACACTGGIADPLPSQSTMPAGMSSTSPSAAPTVSVTEAPAMPPPQRRHPTVVTPVSTASSR